MRNLSRLEVSTNQINDETTKNVKLGKYSVMFDKQIGSGAFSKVYLCKDNENNIVAVKVVSKEKNKTSQAVTIAKAQVRVLKKLKHQGIAQFLESYESQKNFYIVLKYYDGHTLRQVINQKLQLSNDEKLWIISQLVCILRYLNHKKIVHRDLKPDNIKIKKGSKIVLLDFGFAKQLQNGESTELREWVGTPSYMSPQMLSNTKYTSKTDIWSLGIVVYEIFYGCVPFSGNDHEQLLKNINSKQIEFPNKPATSQTIRKFIESCLKVNPKHRIKWAQLFVFDNIKIFKQCEKQENECCRC